ncbi:hypothetical protein KFE25_013748 [Diacronema lutheri]|uniref:Amino acid transporter transmembrane domain-containing protein n=2 Tax=Diacronema lutheri TaxID=2081491 RepID=A0A8J6CG41_DIALT|nr:hypothetical protein KFE25_013748 [Diacronema lutheri]
MQRQPSSGSSDYDEMGATPPPFEYAPSDDGGLYGAMPLVAAESELVLEGLMGLSPPGSPIWRVVGNFTNTIVGAGIVGLPYALHRAGFWCALGQMCGAALMTYYSLKLMVRAGLQLQVSTYEHMCQRSLGRPGFYLATSSLCLFDLGASVSFLIIYADAATRTAVHVLPVLGDEHGAARELVLCASAVPLLALVMHRDLSALESWSSLSVCLVLVLTAFVVAQLFAMGGAAAGADAGAPLRAFGGEALATFGTISFAFVNNDTAFLLYNTIAEPSPRRWSTLSSIGLALALFTCGVFASCGYLTFRGNISDNILNDYADDTPGILPIRAAYALAMLLTFPCAFFVVRHVANELLFRSAPNYTSVQHNSAAKHATLTSVLFFAILAIALSRVKLAFVMSFTGGFAAVMLAFVLPPAAYIASNKRGFSPLLWRNKGRLLRSARDIGPAMLMLAFGLFAAVASPLQAVLCELHPDEWKALC